MWRGRLKGVQRNVEVWQALLSVRTLVLPMAQDTHTWLKFASLCRKSGRVRSDSLLRVRPCRVLQVCSCQVMQVWLRAASVCCNFGSGLPPSAARPPVPVENSRELVNPKKNGASGESYYCKSAPVRWGHTASSPAATGEAHSCHAGSIS